MHKDYIDKLPKYTEINTSKATRLYSRISSHSYEQWKHFLVLLKIYSEANLIACICNQPRVFLIKPANKTYDKLQLLENSINTNS